MGQECPLQDLCRVGWHDPGARPSTAVRGIDGEAAKAKGAELFKNDHTAFRVSDLGAAIRFYTEALGLRLMFRKVNAEEGEAYAFLELAGGNLELIQTLDEPFVRPKLQPPYCPHLALATGDMNQTVETVRAKSIEIVSGPLEIPGEEKWLYISDPDGNVIEFIEWAGGPHD